MQKIKHFRYWCDTMRNCNTNLLALLAGKFAVGAKAVFR